MATEKLIEKVFSFSVFIVQSPKRLDFQYFTSCSPIVVPLRTHFGLDLHHRNHGHKIPHPYQIVSGAGEGKDPIHFVYSTMMQFTQLGDGFQPAKAFLDALPLPLTYRITWMPRRSSINGAAARGGP